MTAASKPGSPLAYAGRRNHPLDRRSRLLIAFGICVATVSSAALVLGHGSSHPTGCATYDRAGFMGNETVTVCKNRRNRLTQDTTSVTVAVPMQRYPNASKKPSLAFVARIRLR